MAKTFNLNPGADTTLVAAATKAAMANVPKDLSGTFEAMSASYEKTMSTIGASFKQAAFNIGKMGGQAAKTALYNRQQDNKGFAMEILVEKEILGPKTNEQATEASKKEEEGALITTDPTDDPTGGVGTNTVKTTIGDELKNIRKELFDLYLKTDPESRKRKAGLRNKRDQFRNDIKFLENADNFSDELLTSNNADLKTTGEFNLFMKQAMNAYKTKTGKINDPKSDYHDFEAVLTRDENDKLAFMFKNADGEFITGKDDDLKPTSVKGKKPFVLTMDKTNSLIKTKLDATTTNNINKAFNDLEKRGANAGTEYMGDQFVNRLRPLFENEDNLHKLIRTPMGDNATSLEHNLNNPSAESAEIFASLSSTTMQKMLDEGYITDTGEKGITKEDFIGSAVAVSNYKKVKNAILDPDNDFYDQQNTTQIALDHVKRTGEVFHNTGKARYNAAAANVNQKNQKTIVDLPWSKGVTINNQTEQNQYNQTMSLARDLLQQSTGQTLRVGQDVWKRNKNNSYTLVETYQSGRLMPVAKDSQDTKTQSQMFQLLPRNKFSPTSDFLREMQKANYPGPLNLQELLKSSLARTSNYLGINTEGGSAASKTAEDYKNMLIKKQD
tara:strand:+ start:101 stop:1939 length:1839 start_codon:yes stop_codon:yes gene_type:complete